MVYFGEKLKKAQRLGTELKIFCNRKYGSQKRASKILDINQKVLSMVINCNRAPNAEFVNKFTRAGFDEVYFNEYFSISDPDPDLLTKKEQADLIRQLFEVIKNKNDVIDILMKQKR